MIYNHSVVYNGKFYRAGEEVPVKEKVIKTEEVVTETDETTKVVRNTKARK